MATIVPVLTSVDPATVIGDDRHAPGNGLCVFFWDANYEFFPAGIGSALGYTNYFGPMAYNSSTITSEASAFVNGIKGGYVGVGFDVKGDFSTTDNGKCGLSARKELQKDPPSTYKVGTKIGSVDQGIANYRLITTNRRSAKTPNSISVRLGELSGYRLLSVSPNLSTYPLSASDYINDNTTNELRYFDAPGVTLHQYVTGRDDPSLVFKSVRVHLLNSGKRIKVEMKDPDTGKFYTYHEADISPDISPGRLIPDGDVPGELRVGLAFSTGESVTNCEIKNFSVNANIVDYTKRTWRTGDKVTYHTSSSAATVFVAVSA